MSTESLNPCPFCGYAAFMTQSMGEWRATCDVCKASAAMYGSKEGAIIAWNKRAQPSEIPDSHTLAKIAADSVLSYENAQGCAGKSSTLTVCKLAIEALCPYIATSKPIPDDDGVLANVEAIVRYEVYNQKDGHEGTEDCCMEIMRRLRPYLATRNPVSVDLTKSVPQENIPYRNEDVATGKLSEQSVVQVSIDNGGVASALSSSSARDAASASRDDNPSPSSTHQPVEHTQDLHFKAELKNCRDGNYSDLRRYARIISARLQQMDKRAKAANERADKAEAMLKRESGYQKKMTCMNGAEFTMIPHEGFRHRIDESGLLHHESIPTDIEDQKP